MDLSKKTATANAPYISAMVDAQAAATLAMDRLEEIQEDNRQLRERADHLTNEVVRLTALLEKVLRSSPDPGQ